MHCVQCQVALSPHARFCPQCGCVASPTPAATALPELLACLHCNASVATNAAFCGSCGTPQTHSVAPLHAHPGMDEAQPSASADVDAALLASEASPSLPQAPALAPAGLQLTQPCTPSPAASAAVVGSEMAFSQAAPEHPTYAQAPSLQASDDASHAINMPCALDVSQQAAEHEADSAEVERDFLPTASTTQHLVDADVDANDSEPVQPTAEAAALECGTTRFTALAALPEAASATQVGGGNNPQHHTNGEAAPDRTTPNPLELGDQPQPTQEPAVQSQPSSTSAAHTDSTTRAPSAPPDSCPQLPSRKLAMGLQSKRILGAGALLAALGGAWLWHSSADQANSHVGSVSSSLPAPADTAPADVPQPTASPSQSGTSTAVLSVQGTPAQDAESGGGGSGAAPSAVAAASEQAAPATPAVAKSETPPAAPQPKPKLPKKVEPAAQPKEKAAPDMEAAPETSAPEAAAPNPPKARSCSEASIFSRPVCLMEGAATFWKCTPDGKLWRHDLPGCQRNN